MTEVKEEKKSFDLGAHHFWAINERSDMGIPAVERDLNTGTLSVLIWTSKELALKYCYMRKPEAVKLLYELPRRIFRDEKGVAEVQQVGLIKIARRILTSQMSEITDFVINHPGTGGGRALYLSVEEMAHLGRRQLPSSVSSGRDLLDFLSSLDEE